MELKIELKNVMIYSDKETGNLKTRLGYNLIDSSMKQITDKFKGFADLAVYYDGDEVFKKIPQEIIGTVVVAIIEEVANVRNPLRKTSIIKGIKVGNSVITLV